MIQRFHNRRVPGEVLVKFRRPTEESPSTNPARFLEEQGAELIKTFQFGDAMLESLGGELSQVRLPADMTPEQARARWSQQPGVEYVANNDILQTTDLNPKNWSLHNEGQTGGTPDADIDAPEAWQIQQGRGAGQDGPLIAVIDTGIDYSHEALSGNIWVNPDEVPGDGIDNDGNGVVDDIHGYDSRKETGTPLDDNGHGTHCAAVIGTTEGNSENLSGVMKNSQIAGIKFLSKLGMGKLSDAIEGIAYADRIGARIVSNSWGGGPYNPAMRDVLAASPALHIFAAGNESNDNDSKPAYPASLDLPNVISVAATDHNDQLAEFSNYGVRSVDLAAPGVNIYSAVHDGGYRELSGTSMATPHVTGAAGLLVSEFPEIDNEEIKARLLNSVDHIPALEGKVRTGGRLNLARALERDDIAPSPTSFLSAQNNTPGRVQVSFSASGDDAMVGQAARYTVKVSEKPIVAGEPGPGQESWDNAALVAEGRPGEPGQALAVEHAVARWSEEKTLHYAVEFQDNVGNASPLSSAQVDLPATRTAFAPEERNDREAWASRWDFEQVEEPGRGLVWTDQTKGSSGAWIQTNNISLADLNSPKLVFDGRYDVEPGRDFLKVEVGVRRNSVAWSWREVARFEGKQEWGVHEIDLSRFKGQEIRVNFKTYPIGRRTEGGVQLDNVSVVDEVSDVLDSSTF